MSYTPTIIADARELEIALNTKREYLQIDYENTSLDDDIRAESYLQTMLTQSDKPKVKGVELIIMRPDMAYFNEIVRDKLREWDVEFGISN